MGTEHSKQQQQQQQQQQQPPRQHPQPARPPPIMGGVAAFDHSRLSAITEVAEEDSFRRSMRDIDLLAAEADGAESIDTGAGATGSTVEVATMHASWPQPSNLRSRSVSAPPAAAVPPSHRRSRSASLPQPHPLSSSVQTALQSRAAARLSSSPDEAEPSAAPVVPPPLAPPSPPPSLDPTFSLLGSSAPPSSSNVLVHALAGGAWDVALTRLTKRPRDALTPVKAEAYGIERRVLPLHLAVAVGAPAEVVRALLEADAGGEAVRTGTRNVAREGRKKRGKRGGVMGGAKGARRASRSNSEPPRTVGAGGADGSGGGGAALPPPPPRPLLPAGEKQVSLKSVTSATTAPHSNRTSDAASSLPPVEVAASDGWLPLHLACLYRSPVEVVEMLLRRHPGAAKIKSGYGLLPLHVVCAGMECKRLRWSEEDDKSLSDPARPHHGSCTTAEKLHGGGGDACDGRAAHDGWGVGDLPRAAELLLGAFPGSVHVPCSRPLQPPSHSPSPVGGRAQRQPEPEHVQMTPIQYARRYLPDDFDTQAVVEMLEGQRRVEVTISPSPSDREEGSEGKRHNVVQSLTTADNMGSKPRPRSRSLLGSFAAAMHLRAPLLSSRKSSASPPRGAAEMMTPKDDEKPTKLYLLISAQSWSAASERLVRHPEEASVWTMVDGEGDALAVAAAHKRRVSGGSFNTAEVAAEEEGEYACHRLPLHRACASKPPADLVKALAEAYPDGIRSREKFAMLPLHVACQRGASPSVITTLLNLYPGAARERDAFGLLPLHLACTEGCSLDVLSALLRSYPGAVEERDVSRRRPIDYVRESLHPNRDGMLRALGRDTNYWFAPSVQDDRSGEVPGLYFAIARKRWDEALERLRSDPAAAGVWVIDANSDSGGSQHPRLPVHAACWRRAPPQVMRALLAAHPAGAAARGGKLDVLPLHMACQYGSDAGSVEELVWAHPEGARTADTFGLLPIHLAVTEGASPSIIRILLRAYPNGAHCKDKRGNTPLAYAQASFHPHKAEVVDMLKEDPGFWLSSSPSLAAAAPRTDHDECQSDEVSDATDLAGLIERREWDRIPEWVGEHPGEAAAPQDVGGGGGARLLPLHRACAAGAPRRAVEALLGAHPAGAKTSSERGDLPLHLACKHGASLDVVETLLEAYPLGASTRDGRGRLPIHIACIAGTTLSVLKVLLRASPGTSEMTDDNGLTPLDYVEESFHKNKVELIDALRQQRSGTMLRGAHTTTLHDLVSEQRWADAISRAREVPSEASVWSIDTTFGTSGRLPIHLACSLKPPRRVVASLINAYVEGVRMIEKDGRTCLHAACQSGASIDVVQLLINSHPNAVSTRDQSGLLPIHVACSKGASINVIKLLLRAAPGSFTAKDGKGWTALKYAEVSHPDHESILAELSPKPDLRTRLVSMRSVPARLGVEEEKKKKSSPMGKVEGVVDKVDVVPPRQLPIDTAMPECRSTGTYASYMLPATKTKTHKSTRSLGGGDTDDESSMPHSIVPISVISV